MNRPAATDVPPGIRRAEGAGNLGAAWITGGARSTVGTACWTTPVTRFIEKPFDLDRLLAEAAEVTGAASPATHS